MKKSSNKIEISFYDEIIVVKSPNTYNELKNIIADRYYLDVKDVEELIMYFINETDRISISNENDYQQALFYMNKQESDKKVLKVFLEVSVQSKLYQNQFEQSKLEVNNEENEKLEKQIRREIEERENQLKEILEKERIETERLEKERIETERLEKERIEKERIEKERIEKERLEKEERERIEKEERERLEKEEKERLEKEKEEKERLEKEKEEKERLEKEEIERVKKAQKVIKEERKKKRSAELAELKRKKLAEQEELKQKKLTEQAELKLKKLAKKAEMKEKKLAKENEKFVKEAELKEQIEKYATDSVNKQFENIRGDLIKNAISETCKIIKGISSEKSVEHSTEKSEIPKAIHEGFTCDGCNANPIIGIRYRCTERSDYDLCETCEAKDSQTYPMIRYKTPLERFEWNKFRSNHNTPKCRPFYGFLRNMFRKGGGSHCPFIENQKKMKEMRESFGLETFTDEQILEALKNAKGDIDQALVQLFQ